MRDFLANYRVFPRAFSVAYLYLLFEVTHWIMNLPAPTVEQAGFASMLVPTAAAWFKFYCSEGK